MARLVRALGTTCHELIPEATPPDTLATPRGQARGLFDVLLAVADGKTLLMLNPLLAVLAGASEQGR